MKTKFLASILLLVAGLFIYSCDDDDYVVSTGTIITTVQTGNAEVTTISATLTGTVLDLSEQASSAYTVGVYYSTKSDPTSGGTKVTGSLADDGTVTTTITGLTTGVTYYYCTFVTLQGSLT